MPDKPHWLHAEESGHEELAESAFASLVAEIPSVEPSAAFVDRAVHAAWQARSRRRRVTRLAYIAGALSIAHGGRWLDLRTRRAGNGSRRAHHRGLLARSWYGC